MNPTEFATLPPRRFARRGSAFVLAVAATLGVSLLLIASPAHADLSDLLMRMTSRGQTTIVRQSQDGVELKLRMSGRPVFTPADDDVESLSGVVNLSEKRGGVTKRIDFTNEKGAVKRVYRVNGVERPLDAEARKWMVVMLQTLIIETGADADARVARLIANEGVSGVLDRVARIRSQHAQVKYLEALMKQSKPTEKELLRAITLVESMDSNYEQRCALNAIIKRQDLNAAVQLALLGATAGIDSDFEKREVLNSLAPKLLPDKAVEQAWREVMGKFDSSFEQRTVIEAMLSRAGVSASQVSLALEATQNIDSDFERATALKTILRRGGALTPTQLQAFLESAKGIDASFELRGTLVALVERTGLDKASANAVLTVIDGIDSDFEKRTAMVALAKRMPNDRELLERYRDSARAMGGYERSQAERAVDRLRQ